MRKGARHFISIFVALVLPLQGISPALHASALPRPALLTPVDLTTSAFANVAIWQHINRTGIQAFAARKIGEGLLHIQQNPFTIVSYATLIAMIADHLIHSPAMTQATTLMSSILFVDLNANSFLETTEGHLIDAAEGLNVSHDDLRELVKPFRDITGSFPVRRNGNKPPLIVTWWRKVQGKPGKGGDRDKTDVETVTSLSIDMDLKPDETVTVQGSRLRGAKGGIDIDLSTLDTDEKVRVIRGWVNSIMDTVLEIGRREQSDYVAFGPLFDVPAPDSGTSPPDVNLMDYRADEVNRWLVNHAEEVLPWLTGPHGDFRLARDLKILVRDIQTHPIVFNEAGPQTELPYVNRILQLRHRKELNSLRLLACVTGKTAPTRDLKNNDLNHDLDIDPNKDESLIKMYGRGGIRGRKVATGLGIGFVNLELMILNGDLPPGSRTFEYEENGILKRKSVIVQGAGNVGWGAIQSFEKLRAVVKGFAEKDFVENKNFVFYSETGFPEAAQKSLERYKKKHHNRLWGYEKTPEAKKFGITVDLAPDNMDIFWGQDVDVIVPAATTENVIDDHVAHLIRARYVIEGTNGPTTNGADKILLEKGTIVAPDIISNSGGVVTSWMEILQDILEWEKPWSERKVSLSLHNYFKKRIPKLYFSAAAHLGKSYRAVVHREWLKHLRDEQLEKRILSLNQAA